MSNKVTFQIVHGEGNIRFGPDGVDLSDFVMTSKGIDRPAERTFQSIYSWLLRGFRIDQEVYTMSVSVVVSRATEGYFWELMPMDSTAAWRRYVEMAFERSWPLVIFVSVQEKDINVSMQTEDVKGPINAGDVVGPSMQNEKNQPREEQAMGMADEGERVGIIVDEMEREDSDNEEADDDASSDEEGDVMATDWANEDFSGLVISEGDHVPWEYKENEVIDGARYAHKDEMKEAVKHWAVSLQREFRVVKSTNYVYEVRCMKEDCPWRVHAYKGKWNDYWKVSIVTEHKCYLQGVEKYHRNITSAFVASEMYSSVVGNIGFEPKSIIRHIENKFKYTISYAKAWRAKQKIIEMRYGTFEASYDNLPRLLATIAQRNNNTYYDLHTFTSVDDRTKSVLQRAFFSLGACINAFVHCRPVLCIDGTFMTGKYRGQILTAIGCDGNNQNGWDEKGLPAKWPDVRSRWCMSHMGANFYKQFKNKHFVELFKRLCAQNQEKKFNELWDKLDELTTKQTDEQSRRPQVEGDEPPIPLGALHDDPPTMRRRSGSSIRNFTQWIENEPKEKWSLLFDTDGSRKEAIFHTWSEEIYGFGISGSYTTLSAQVFYIPDPSKLRVKKGRRQTRRIRNDMDESEAGGRTLRCSKCDLRGHTYKKCPKNAEVPSGADASPSGQASDGMAYDTPALLNRGIDRNHRSFLSALEGAQLGTFRPRTSREWLRVDPRHVPWLRAAGLLPLCRLVEAAADDRDPAKRWDADRSLLAALVDCWRPETHTFHLPCGEMAPTLQDVSYLLGLPLAGARVGPVDGVFGWKEDITARFEQVMRLPHLGPANTLPPYSTVGPSKAWLLQFTADLLHPDADDNSVRRSLEAYLLWLFGWVMFTSTHGHAVDFRLVHYARSIADAQPQDVPQCSWGSAVLAATYRALCEACTKTDAGAIIAGCPMLLQLWAAERFAIGRPVVDSAPYGVGRSAQWPEDGPTMGTYWCRRGRRYAHVQVRRGYPDYVFEFDRLQPSDVIWEPYTEEAVAARAPLGLSSLCTRDQAYWLTILPMVFDIFVEPHCPQRVMRQFGLRQVFPGNVQPTVLPADHSLTRRGQLAGALAPRVQQYVDDWVLATEEVINELFPHTEENYRDYLHWYLPRTRARVTFTPDAPEPHVAAVTDAYPTHRDRDYFVGADAARDISADITAVQVRLNRGLHLTDVEQRVTFDRMQEKMRAVMRVFSCRSAVDVVPPAGPVQPRPRAPIVGTGPRPTVPVSHAGFAAGIFGTGASSSHAGRTGPTSQFYDDDLHGAHHHDVLGSSQLGGAPEAHTQEQPEVTPVQAGRVGRAIPPDRLTYSQGHIRAQGRRDRVLFIHMMLEQLMLTTTHFRRFTTYRPMCNFIEWVDMENPQNDGTRAYPRSETRSDYLRWKDEHERRIAAEALEWHGNPRMGGFTQWIDNVTPSYHGQKITESATQVEYQRLKDHENAMHSDRPRRGR
ncbi:Os07g0238100 [Oryza sativa Japonica Group]|uniref:Os07g0238100 protein n=1 Tax=Oryza sativa subsp. japonica TaxID=39947 RepID=C7J4Y0_ORYSJ|nr:Os07g0238100 [Oryza sativa Japonica Group]|eukprot:NP_001175113.1 Os07g0238100 [Oryza sativa Japonica Group]